jgi:hypothetical protein
LFLYLKMLPLNVGTPDLYYLRAAGTETAGIS